MTIGAFRIIRIQSNKDVCDTVDGGNMKGFDPEFINIQDICDKIKHRVIPPRSMMFFCDHIVERGGIILYKNPSTPNGKGVKKRPHQKLKRYHNHTRS